MICPNCQNEQRVTEQNYGALYTCPSCQAVYFINFDGKPEFGEVSGEEYANAKMEIEGLIPEVAGIQTPPLGNEIGSLEPLVSTNELVQNNDNFDAFSPPELENSGDPQIFENPFELQNNMAAMNNDLTQAQIDQQIKRESTAVKKATPPPKVSPKAVAGLGSFNDIAQEISEFANTDSQLSGLNYDVVISGIDTQETKNLFKEAIEDSKFAWDPIEIMKTLKNGRVEIRRMSPAKAFLLARRIQFLDVEKAWKQNGGA